MQRKWTRPAQSCDSHTAIQVVRRIRREVFLVITIVQPCPFFLILVPPHQLLALAPGCPIGARRGAVINNSAIVRPGKSPALPEQIFRCPFVGAIAPFLRKDSAINPRTTRGRT